LTKSLLIEKKLRVLIFDYSTEGT